jgi:aspartyl-tRNA(Asn)/glutamyl-tRNA(Gln) amidotransferase subunit B
MSTNTATTASEFELVSGLEIHVQLNTNTKIFSSDSASFGAGPNEHISTVSLALPGALPKLNKEVVEKAVKMGLALHCTINQVNYFDRKNYFYADLPKGYQITQDNLPICQNGYLDVTLGDGSIKRIGINRIHLEEDAGKSMHDQHDLYSYVDLNRAGVPLIEIVTEPDLRSAEEASALLTEMRKLVRHLDVSDGNMEEGSLRCDANISIRKPGTTAFGTRCEVKNLNSIRNVRRAMDFEYSRQVDVVSQGGNIIQSTLNFDADNGTTSPMRSKEMANDYRYFPDPDLAPMVLTDEWLERVKATMPALPSEITQELMECYGISNGEASLLAGDAELLAFFHEGVATVKHKKSLINWLVGPIRALLNDRGLSIADYAITPLQIATVINLCDDKKVTQQVALQQLLPALETDTQADPTILAKSLNLWIEENDDELNGFIDEVLAKYAAQVNAYKKGKKGVIGLFVGEVIKMAKGKADPQKVNILVQEKLA